MMRLFLAAILLSGITACASGPYGQLLGDDGTSADPYNHDVIIVGIDGRYYPTGLGRRTIDPGPHELLVRTTKPSRSGSGYDDRQFFLNVEPCTRYYLSAQHPKSATISTRDWEVRLLRSEPISECRTESEGENGSEVKQQASQ
ncbi:MAG: hypothetical protein R3270_04455 [Gammaproteobacteria bacterium]|nr:hypothetical protein [Gammaproteobacteria bacterium]